jgi:hypothetical protein
MIAIMLHRFSECFAPRTVLVMSTSLALAPSIADLDALAHEAAERGVDSDRALVVQVVRAASAAGADPVLADVVTDPREPEVARQRALGALLAHLVDGRRHHDTDAVREAVADPRDTLPAWPVRAC